MRFSSARKTRLARGARNDRAPTSADAGEYFELQQSGLRGRRPVRADRRFGADEKHIRTQSAILYKDKPKPLLLLFRSRHATACKSNSKSAHERVKVDRPRCRQGGDKTVKTAANRALP